MTDPDSRTQFASLVAGPDSELDLAHASLLIASEEYPGLDIAAYEARLDGLARTLRSRLEDLRAPAIVDALGRLLFEEEGFRGNEADYYDPRNSFLNEVLDRRMGIPITLSAVYMEVGRRAGIDVHGVGLPGHFVVRVSDGGQEVLVDPFHAGRVLSEDDCQKRLDRIYEGRVKLEPELLVPQTPRAILARMLRNLKAIYVKGGDHARALKIIELLVATEPGAPEEIRDRGLVYAALECYGLAARDLEAYLVRMPLCAEAAALRQEIEEMRRKGARLH